MRSLLLKLLTAFALVILIGALVNSLLMSYASRGQLQNYMTQNGRIWASETAPLLADYYAHTGSWTGVDVLLRSPWAGMMVNAVPSGGGSVAAPGGGAKAAMSEMMTPGMMESGGMTAHMMNGELWNTVGFRPLLTDDQGNVIAAPATSEPAAQHCASYQRRNWPAASQLKWLAKR